MGEITKEKLACVAVDSDLVSLRLLKSLIGRVGRLTLLHLFDKPEDAFYFMNTKKVDLLFWTFDERTISLDVLNELPNKPALIAMYNEHFQGLSGLDYMVSESLLKPLSSYAKFSEVVDNVIDEVMLSAEIGDSNVGSQPAELPSSLFVKVDSLLLNLVLTDVLWVKAYGDYVKIFTEDKTYVVLSKFQFIIDRLPGRDFARVHRSYLVRIDKIKKIDQNNLSVGSQVIPISRSYRKEFLNKIVIL